MRKIFTFMLLAAALLVSVPSWAEVFVPGEERSLSYYELPQIGHWGNTNDFGTICVPERIVATQGIRIYEVLCVDKLYNDGNNDGNLNTTPVARLVVLEHTTCNSSDQNYADSEGELWYDENQDGPYCPKGSASGDNPCDKKVYYDWSYHSGATYEPYHEFFDYHMVAGAPYFYTVCSNAYDMENRRVYVDTNVERKASKPVCRNGFYGTFEQTTFNTPVTVLTKNTTTGTQYIETVTKATIPAYRGYFKGNFEGVPWRWNTDTRTEDKPYPSGVDNPIHYPSTSEVKAAPRNLSNAVAFNVGPRDAATGLYPIDLEHPIYLNQETNKRIDNGQLIIEAADGTKYNAFGQKL